MALWLLGGLCRADLEHADVADEGSWRPLGGLTAVDVALSLTLLVWRMQVRDLHERCQKLGLSVAFRVERPPREQAAANTGIPFKHAFPNIHCV